MRHYEHEDEWGFAEAEKTLEKYRPLMELYSKAIVDAYFSGPREVLFKANPDILSLTADDLTFLKELGIKI